MGCCSTYRSARCSAFWASSSRLITFLLFTAGCWSWRPPAATQRSHSLRCRMYSSRAARCSRRVGEQAGQSAGLQLLVGKQTKPTTTHAAPCCPLRYELYAQHLSKQPTPCTQPCTRPTHRVVHGAVLPLLDSQPQLLSRQVAQRARLELACSLISGG